LTLDLFWHDDALLHETGSGVFEHPPSPLMDVPELHPENAVRVRNMKAILERGPLAPHIRPREGRHAEVSELTTLHDPDYIESVREFCAAGGGVITWSTTVGERSWEAALAAAGTALAATDAVLSGETKTAYALVRPPGHYAQPAQADGYCLFSNAALAAERARRSGLERVAVLDWDVHHGNGTQECFYDRDDVLTVSFHMRHGAWGPSHPQTGGPDEVGTGRGEGFFGALARDLDGTVG
jgi:acetoin utilization deacetylase AcuC-like enzyme